MQALHTTGAPGSGFAAVGRRLVEFRDWTENGRSMLLLAKASMVEGSEWCDRSKVAFQWSIRDGPFPVTAYGRLGLAPRHRAAFVQVPMLTKSQIMVA